MNVLTETQASELLQSQFESLQFAEASFVDGTAGLAQLERAASSQVLAKVAEFLGEFSEFLPSKETFLAAVSKAIDLAFAASPRPFLTNLIKPAVKVLILDAAGAMYDSLAKIGTEQPEPRTEV